MLFIPVRKGTCICQVKDLENAVCFAEPDNTLLGSEIQLLLWMWPDLRKEVVLDLLRNRQFQSFRKLALQNLFLLQYEAIRAVQRLNINRRTYHCFAGLCTVPKKCKLGRNCFLNWPSRESTRDRRKSLVLTIACSLERWTAFVSSSPSCSSRP